MTGDRDADGLTELLASLRRAPPGSVFLVRCSSPEQAHRLIEGRLATVHPPEDTYRAPSNLGPTAALLQAEGMALGHLFAPDGEHARSWWLEANRARGDFHRFRGHVLIWVDPREYPEAAEQAPDLFHTVRGSFDVDDSEAEAPYEVPPPMEVLRKARLVYRQSWGTMEVPFTLTAPRRRELVRVPRHVRVWSSMTGDVTRPSRADATKVLLDNPRLLLSAAPGSGVSTALQDAGLSMLETGQGVPLLVRGSDLPAAVSRSSRDDPWSAALNCLAPESEPVAPLRLAQWCWLLVDGVPPGSVRQVVQWIGTLGVRATLAIIGAGSAVLHSARGWSAARLLPLSRQGAVSLLKVVLDSEEQARSCLDALDRGGSLASPTTLSGLPWHPEALFAAAAVWRQDRRFPDATAEFQLAVADRLLARACRTDGDLGVGRRLIRAIADAWTRPGASRQSWARLIPVIEVEAVIRGVLADLGLSSSESAPWLSRLSTGGGPLRIVGEQVTLRHPLVAPALAAAHQIDRLGSDMSGMALAEALTPAVVSLMFGRSSADGLRLLQRLTSAGEEAAVTPSRQLRALDVYRSAWLRARPARPGVEREFADSLRRGVAAGIEDGSTPDLERLAFALSIADADPRIDTRPWVRFGTALFVAPYLVTVAEFARFVNDGGYRDEALWTEAGKRWVRSQSGRRSPKAWDIQRDYGNAPVSGINFHEALAYAAWRARTLPNCRLPRLSEWLGMTHATAWEPTPNNHCSRLLNTPGPVPVGVFGPVPLPGGAVFDLYGNLKTLAVDPDGSEWACGTAYGLASRTEWRDHYERVKSAGRRWVEYWGIRLVRDAAG